MAAKFKVGDRVKVLRKRYIDYHIKIGDEYIIKGWVNMFGDYYYLMHDNSPFCYNEDDLELVESKSNILSTKSPTLSEVVDLIKEMRIIMTVQGRSGDDISQIAHNICKQYGYDLPEGIEKE